MRCRPWAWSPPGRRSTYGTPRSRATSGRCPRASATGCRTRPSPWSRRIGDLLIDALARVAGQGEPEVVVRRTATVYLPDTLRAYLSLPADWAADHVFPDGTTAAAALVGQLTELERAAKRMRDAAVEHDASALLVNGRFLSERFGASRLDLP
ncbi:hypothetical protein [Streptomyces sp. L7]|uniref:hypothetical protein n=1 Tax=Streptomyces sp. L7 TaxID=3423954 RepID=UPI003D955A99